MWYLIAVIVGVAVLVAASYAIHPKLEAVLAPRCTGRAWRRAFPTVAKQDIRSYLDIVLNAFELRRRNRLRLDPDLRILTLYEACGPVWLGLDSMELESLELQLRDCYGIDLPDIWHDDMTIGGLFVHVSNSSRGRSPSYRC